MLTVLALHWLIARENFNTKDDLTSQTLNKLFELQRTLYMNICNGPKSPFIKRGAPDLDGEKVVAVGQSFIYCRMVDHTCRGLTMKSLEIHNDFGSLVHFVASPWLHRQTQ